MKRSSVFLFLSLVSILVLAAACGTAAVATPRPISFVTPTAGGIATAGPSVSPPAETPAAASTVEAVVPTAAPTGVPTAAVPTGLPNTGPSVTRIQFAAGATDVVVGGHLAANGSAHYVLRANVGQIMRVSLAPDQEQAILVIWGANGDVLISDHATTAYWEGRLPSTQDYYIDVRAAPGAAVDYSLHVVIPERIQFAPGGTSASVKGTLSAATSHSYVLGAAAGQTMSVDLSYPSGQALVIIWGADGTVLISDHAEAKQWSGLLPGTQDYYIDVRAAAGSTAVAYTLKVTIPPLSTPGGEPQATRIQFPAGGTSATMQGSVPAGGVKRYVLKALAGQTMTVALTPDSAQAYLVIWGVDGSVLMSGNWQSKEYSGVLTITEDYYIDVHSAANNSAVAYTLRVTIPPLPGGEPQSTRIEFKSGSTSATVQGSVPSGGVKRYVLRALRGQSMNVTLTLASGGAYLVIRGQDGSVLLPGNGNEQQWSGVLPVTGDYYIDVTAFNASPTLQFSLKVAIPPLQ